MAVRDSGREPTRMLDCWRPSKWLLLYTEQSRFWMPPTPQEPLDQGGRLRQEVVRIPRGAVRLPERRLRAPRRWHPPPRPAR